MKQFVPWYDQVFSGLTFKILYLLLALFSFNAFVYYQPIMQYLVWFVTIFGVLNCLYRLFNYKRYGKTPYLLLALLIMASYITTMIFNIRYGFIEDLQGLVWMGFQFLMLYVCDMDKPYEELKVEFRSISLIFIAYNTLACAISTVMVLFNYGQVLFLNAVTVIPRGFVWGRLWGVFSDPNYGSASVCIGSILCLFFLNKVTKRYQKFLAIFSLAIYFLYIVFSDSRTGYVALLCSMFFWFYIRLSIPSKMSIGKSRKGIYSRSVIATALSLVIIAGTLGAMVSVKELYNAAITVQQDQTQSQSQSQSNGNNNQIERDYTEKVDISNRRLSLWKSGFELFQTSPIVGVGFRNIQAVAEDRIPNTYLINNSLGKFSAFHNMWVDLLASQGLVGFLSFLVFALCCAVSAIRLLHRLKINKSPDYLWVGMLLSVLTVSVVSSLFLSDTIYVNTPNAVMFWILLGYLMRFVSDKKALDKLPNSDKPVKQEDVL